ncbi:DUF6030 family protein [Rhizobiaceae bacterium n13]|uniref:DUF6030 family protein n=1 Tax=Ferirhizobium litorale TaxID=2927786 RepID=A0AAE3U3W9_9HYPH|nr:DUF6030 family protein [Fererhizobium litorale]MDI7862317.1 DUF6030 family protein [Fererhizobium litorale]MDI7922409.1 DUF6030 family protein [Fererhizobium litorale]
MRNLRTAFRHYDIAWPFDAPLQQSPAPNRQTTDKRASQPIQLPDGFFQTERPDSLGRFQRQVYLTGPDLCALFNDAGIANTGWQASPFNPNTFECISERKLVRMEDPDNYASFFLSMKGTPDGAVNVIRMKAILPDNADGRTMKQELVETIKVLIDNTHWNDFAPAVEKIAKLEDFELGRFGVELKFSREFGDSRGFNLVLSLAGRTTELQTRSYFDRNKWLRLPQHLISTPKQLL